MSCRGRVLGEGEASSEGETGKTGEGGDVIDVRDWRG